MAPTDTSKLVDRIIPGGLNAFLTDARDNGDTYADIVFTLRMEHQIEVTQDTVRRWTIERILPAPEPTEAAT